MERDVNRILERGRICHIAKTRGSNAGLYTPLSVPTSPWEDVSLDFVLGLPYTQNNKDSVMVVVDRFSKLTHFVPCLKTFDASQVAKLYLYEIVKLYGMKVISDVKVVLYKESDLVWIHLHKERFLAGRFGKLKPRADGPFRVLKKINENAYKIELPNHYDVSATFNVVDLSPYKGCSEYETYLRSSLSEEGEDDPGNDTNLIANMLSSYFAEVHSTKGVDWREHPDPRCLLASAIVHPTRNSSGNSPGLQEHHLE
ncbi:RNA-directed DNA polymerase [Tanacetum coccineum]